MKQTYFSTAILLLLSISSCVNARPGPGPDVPFIDSPHFLRELSPDYKTVVVAGVTYFVLDNLWYVMHGDRYQQVQAPASSNVTIINNGTAATTTTTAPAGMSVVDVNGIRYYVKAGHYYRLNSDGQYLEVTPPREITG